jgi:hypothetical protein
MSTRTQVYSAGQRADLLRQWRESGKSKKAFCQEHGLKYHTFVCWKEDRDSVKEKTSFLPVTVRDVQQTFAQLILPGGAVLNICHPVDASYLSELLK